jgi:hypothetical protein
MTNLSSTFTLLRAEIESTIAEITPHEWPQHRFVARRTSETAASAIDEVAGKPRSFALDDLRLERHVTFGCGNHQTEYSWRLSIVYPRDPEWEIYAHDDIEHIAQYLRVNHVAGVANVQIREVDVNTPPLLRPVEEDVAWSVMEARIFASLNVEGDVSPTVYIPAHTRVLVFEARSEIIAASTLTSTTLHWYPAIKYPTATVVDYRVTVEIDGNSPPDPASYSGEYGLVTVPGGSYTNNEIYLSDGLAWNNVSLTLSETMSPSVDIGVYSPNTVYEWSGVSWDDTGTTYNSNEWSTLGFRVPADWNGASDMTARVVWISANTALASGENVVWDIEYKSKSEGDTSSSGTAVAITGTETGGASDSAYQIYYTDITIDYDDANQTIADGDYVQMRLCRDIDGGTDDYGKSIYLIAVEIRYTADALGQ